MASDHPKTPVMADVALLAGVSHQTVSRVLNGHPHIRQSTRERVERAIAQLSYQPNTAARALVRGRSGLIGIVTGSGAFYGPRSAHQGVSAAARKAGYSVTSVELDDITEATLAAAVEDLSRLGVEGLIVVAGHDAAVDVARKRAGALPIVVVEGDLTRAAMSAGVDQVAGAVAATEHLIGLGHRRIAHISGPPPSGRLEPRIRLHRWTADRSRCRDHGGLRQQRPDGPWRTASPPGGRPQRPRRCLPRRLRRHPRGCLPVPTTHDRAPRLCCRRAPGHRGPGCGVERSRVAHARVALRTTDRAGQHRTAAKGSLRWALPPNSSRS